MNTIKNYLRSLLPGISKSFVFGIFLVLGLLSSYVSVRAFMYGSYDGHQVAGGETLTADMWNRLLNRGTNSYPWDINQGFHIKSPGNEVPSLSIINNSSSNPLVIVKQGQYGNAGMWMFDKDGRNGSIIGSHHLWGGFLTLNNGTADPMNPGDPSHMFFKDNCTSGNGVSLGSYGGNFLVCGGSVLIVKNSSISNGMVQTSVDGNGNPMMELRGKAGGSGGRPYIDFQVSNDPTVWGAPSSREDFDARIEYTDNGDKLGFISNKFDFRPKDTGLAQLCLNGACVTSLGGGGAGSRGNRFNLSYDADSNFRFRSNNGEFNGMDKVMLVKKIDFSKNFFRMMGSVEIGGISAGPTESYFSVGHEMVIRPNEPGQNSDLRLVASPGKLWTLATLAGDGSFEINRDDTGQGPAISIKQNNNIGIGNQNPSSKLDVSGTLTLSDGISSNDIFFSDEWSVERSAGRHHIQAGPHDGPVGSPEYPNPGKLYLNPWEGAGDVYVGGGDSSTHDLRVDHGNIYTNQLLQSSDIRYKKDVKNLTEMLDKVSKLQGVSYTLIKDNTKTMGLIAQDIEKIFPQVVDTNENGYKSVNYLALIAPIIESIKELINKNNVTNSKVSDLQSQVDDLKKENQLMRADILELKNQINLLTK